jgi:Transposase, Mutator family
MIAESWRRNWEQIIPFYSYPPEVRKIIYTTNAIESLHMQLRKALKNRGHFPSDEAATKLIYLALRNITKSWKNPRSPGGWRPTNSRSNSGRDLTNEAYAFRMGATRPHNPAARGELLDATAPWQNRSRTESEVEFLREPLIRSDAPALGQGELAAMRQNIEWATGSRRTQRG